MTCTSTVEIPDEYRAKLLELAGRRGQKGFSSLVTEALQLFLEREDRNEGAIERALAAKGSLDDRQAEELREAARAIRQQWR